MRLDFTRMKLRWWLAYQVNRLPGQCWADLVTWAMNPGGWREMDETRWPWRPIRSCREDAARVGYCYCGKIRDEAGIAAWDERVRLSESPTMQRALNQAFGDDQ